jgi:hypothetical protein
MNDHHGVPFPLFAIVTNQMKKMMNPVAAEIDNGLGIDRTDWVMVSLERFSISPQS